MSDKVAIIDCGTNTFHLLIVELGDDQLTEIVKDKTVVKIGEGGINNKVITESAQERALLALKSFKEQIDANEVSEVFAFATSAFRNANNGEALQLLIQEQTGIEIKIIPGEQEAAYIFYGVNSAMDIGLQPVLVMDIGGGSVEFIIGTKDDILWKKSFEVGAQRLLDLFHKHEPIALEDLKALEAYTSDQLSDLLKALQKYKPHTLIGSSGTFDTLSAIYCAEEKIPVDLDAKEVPLTIEAYLNIHKELITKNREERLAIPGMIAMRVDMIVVASALIDFLLKRHVFSNIRVSTYALKEGVLSQVMAKQL